MAISERVGSVTNVIGSAKTRLIDALGGPARFQVILVLGAVLGLDTADEAVSAVCRTHRQY